MRDPSHCKAHYRRGCALEKLHRPEEALAAFLLPHMAEVYPRLAAMPDHFYFELFHLCALLVLRQPEVEEHEAVRAIKEVLAKMEQRVGALAERGGGEGSAASPDGASTERRAALDAYRSARFAAESKTHQGMAREGVYTARAV